MHRHTVYYGLTPPPSLQVSCGLDMYSFPFDSHTCQLWYGPWVQTIQDVVISNVTIEIVYPELAGNAEFEIKGVEV